MKILQIGSHYDKGGAARVMTCIHRQLLKTGEASYVAYGRGNKVEEENDKMLDGISNIFLYLSLLQYYRKKRELADYIRLNS